jgi:ATP-dependent exoDNAse (exonuclease V) beta subunit
MSDRIPDAPARRRAIDPNGSFIVQAPAGSGKTELLAQRYLCLLARVDEPEEIVAITFTRKAAAEMRGRILDALRRGSEGPPPAADHERQTWELARAAMARDELRGWRLLELPNRLRVQTIDALCATLTARMPLESGFGAQPRISDRPFDLYREAARETVRLVDSGDTWADAVAAVLRHLGNDLARLDNLLVEMLGRRDQWLAHAGAIDGTNGRAVMEQALARLVEEALAETGAACTEAVDPRELMTVCRLAAEQGRDIEALQPLRNLSRLPDATAEALPVWQALAELLLTAQGDWRRTLTRQQGFPSPTESGLTAAERAARKAAKARATQFLETLQSEGCEAFRGSLQAARQLPSPRYDDAAWTMLAALCDVLRLAAANLRLVFAREGEVDFAEIAFAALRALGPPEAPTDLSLALDYRLRHLLMDEFQDTSLPQFELLRRLTAGWAEGDGRSLFVVGDPMQSIYRFREAEVGLFLRARVQGVGDIQLEPLHLQANFRSSTAVVDWVNQAFAGLMPVRENIAAGAVPYSPAVAVHPAADDADGVRVHAFGDGQTEAETEAAVDAVADALAAGHESVGVLVRARPHAAAIAAALRRRGIGYLAVDLEGLAQRPVIRDLLCLTRALLLPADRLAWLSVLRAPWCGLDLSDLTRLAGDDHRHRAVPAQLASAPVLAALSKPGRARVERLRRVLDAAHAQRRRQTLSALVEGVWLALGGPATARDRAALADAEAFFRLLGELETGADLEDVEQLETELQRLFAAPDTDSDGRVQIMTIHRSKGLEFDTVVLPGLGRTTRGSPPPLLRWVERPRRDGDESDLILAPIRPAGADVDPVYATLGRLDAEKEALENVRLLYVAATRARRRLHVVAAAARGKDTWRPAAGSLLAPLWPAVSDHWDGADVGADGTPEPPAQAPMLQRLPQAWAVPAPPAAVTARAAAATAVTDADIEYRWAGRTARYVGSLVHRYLQYIAEQGVERWNAERVGAERARILGRLRGLGVPEEELAMAADRAVDALTATLSDATGRWLLDGDPARQPRSEYALSGRIGGRLVNATIDRTFVDDGVRWVIDYKTGEHEGGDLERFIAVEMDRYRQQLGQYAALVQRLDQRPVRAGLYFPLLGIWRAYD